MQHLQGPIHQVSQHRRVEAFLAPLPELQQNPDSFAAIPSSKTASMGKGKATLPRMMPLPFLGIPVRLLRAAFEWGAHRH